MRLTLVGPPGAGKGTQAQFLASNFAVPKISTGDIFRRNVSEGTPLGLEARKFMDAGDLVPDEVTIGMVKLRLAEADARDGFLLDGFPRTVRQAIELDDVLSGIGTKLDVVLELEVNEDEVVRRLSGRRTCHRCGHVWHVDFDPPTQRDTCDHCSGQLYQRDDDQPETVRHRLVVYTEQTVPLVDFYADRGILVGINATGSVENVTKRAIAALRRFSG